MCAIGFVKRTLVLQRTLGKSAVRGKGMLARPEVAHTVQSHVAFPVLPVQRAYEHSCPLSVKTVGIGLLPLQLRLKPNVTEPPGAMVPFHVALVT